MLTDEMITRIEATVPALNGRAKEAADLAELVRRKALPQAPATAFVLPLGLRPRSEADAAAGGFTQMLDETVGVLLVVRAAGDATGAKALPQIGELIDALIAAIAGWGPDTAIGVFRVARGQLLSAEAGAVMYQLDFSIQTQVRNFG